MSGYDLDVLVIGGGGSGGFTAATTAMRSGARVGMAESGRLGGLCILAGCMPSKTLLHAAAANLAAPRPPEELYPGVLARKRQVVEFLAGKRVEAVRGKEMKGLKVFEGRARFLDAHTLDIAGARLSAGAVVIATGSRERVPALPGLAEADYLTAETFMEAPVLPASLIVLGGGAIALELAQYARRMGAAVTILQRGERLLSKEAPAVGEALARALRDEGVKILTGTSLERVEAGAEGKTVFFRRGGAAERATAAEILLAQGRAPALEGLGLEAAGVWVERGALAVDRAMRTSVAHIFAAGDVTGVNMVVNLAVLQGEVAGENAAKTAAGGPRPGQARLIDDRVLPRAVFTDPQFARVGLSRAECEAAGLDFMEAGQELADMGVSRTYPRPVPGFMTMRAAKGEGRILGADLVAPEASLMIHDVAVAMKLKGTARDLADIPYIHPCLSEITNLVAEKLARLAEG